MEPLLTLCLVVLVSASKEAQNIPASYTYSTTDIISVNGSSATGHCSSVTINCDGTTTCAAPSSSVQFDGHIPTLTGLDGDMWASRLLTLQPTTGMAAGITFDFSNHPNFRLQRLEVVMFNCPQRGTAVQNIRLFDTTEIVIISPTITSCDSLVSVCTQASTSTQSLSLQLNPRPGSQWVYLAELRFWVNGATCPPDTIFTTPPTPETDANINTSPSAEFDTTAVSFSTTQPEVCMCASNSLSTILASVVSIITTALLTTVISVLVQTAICRCRSKSTPGKAETGTSAGGEGQVYKLQVGGKGGMAASDPTHRAGGGRGNNFKMKKNKSYEFYGGTPLASK